jgi:transposase
MVVAQSNDPARSIADVALEHGLNANIIARWRRAHEPTQSIPQAQPAETFIPVHLPVPAPQTSSIVVECGAVRVRFDGPLDLNALRTVLATLRSSS